MKQKEYYSIQVLRGVAAMMVVLYHIMVRLAEFHGVPESEIYGHMSAGADIFFVISGFVMAISSESLRQKADGWRTFIRRRLIRVVPLYWLLTTVKICLVALAGHGSLSLVNALASYFFIPSHNAAGEVKMILPVGWTLSFEMLFYACFALALSTRMTPIRLLVPVFSVVGVASLFRGDDWPVFSQLLSMFPLEFIFGVAIGNLMLKGKRLPARAAALVLLAGIAAILTLPVGPAIGAAVYDERVDLRVLAWGVPAAMIIAGLVNLEDSLSFPRWLLVVGDSSYSIYLTHGFLLATMPLLLSKGFSEFLLAPAMVLGCAFIGILTYRLVENRMTEGLKPLGVVSSGQPAR
jgi:exopolysaccharide production protein ExoZ